MTIAIAQEESLAPDVMVPVQFQRLWHESTATTPERILAMNVIFQAANDLRTFRFSRRRKKQRLYMDAYSWIASNDRSWPYAFLNLCDALRLSAGRVRAELFGDASQRPAPAHGAPSRLIGRNPVRPQPMSRA